jgi:exodeoxyribonuclease V alpha subunit
VFLAGLHRAERVIADRVMRLADGTLLPWPWIDPDKALPWVEERIGLALAGSQVGAIRLALISNVPVMTGGPARHPSSKPILRIVAAKGVRLLTTLAEFDGSVVESSGSCFNRPNMVQFKA